MRAIARKAGIVVLLLLAWSSQALAIVWRHDVNESDYRSLAGQPQFGAVGKVYAVGVGAGSGTLIGDGSWVLTAAHVVSGATSVQFEVGTAFYTASAIYIHPSYNSLRLLNDLALVKLSNPIPGVAPARLYTGRNEVGMIGYTVGYGAGGNGITGYTGGYGIKRAMQNVIDLSLTPLPTGGYLVDPNGTLLISDFDSPSRNSNTLGAFGSSPNPLPLEGMAAPGDSGGATFVLEGGSWYLAGVTSFLADVGAQGGGDGVPNAKYGDLLGSVRVSSYLDWIYQYIGSPTPSPVIPEPTTLTMMAIGLAVLARRLRR